VRWLVLNYHFHNPGSSPHDSSKHSANALACLVAHVITTTRKLAENLDSLETKVSSYRQNILPQLTVGICTDNDFELLENVFGGRGDKYAASLTKAVETVECCIERRRRETCCSGRISG
jgi:hypothetical protein